MREYLNELRWRIWLFFHGRDKLKHALTHLHEACTIIAVMKDPTLKHLAEDFNLDAAAREIGITAQVLEDMISYEPIPDYYKEI